MSLPALDRHIATVCGEQCSISATCSLVISFIVISDRNFSLFGLIVLVVIIIDSINICRNHKSVYHEIETDNQHRKIFMKNILEVLCGIIALALYVTASTMEYNDLTGKNADQVPYSQKQQ